MAPRLSGQTSIFGVVFFVSKSPLGIERQKKLVKFAILTRKPRSHARILLYRTWPIENCGQSLTSCCYHSWKEAIESVSSFTLHVSKQRIGRYEDQDFTLINLGIIGPKSAARARSFLPAEINFRCPKCYTFWLNRGNEIII